MKSRILRSVFRVGWPRTRQARLQAMLSSLVLHVHPTRVRVHVLRPSYTLGLGLVSFFLFVVLTVTGLALMLYYVPHPDAAYRSMKDIEYAVTFGMFLRNAHRWAAHGMVATVFLHLCRVFFTGAYKPPREFNWVVGVLLLLLTLALSFTGYLLPWDQLAFWAITVGTAIVAYFPVLGRRCATSCSAGTRSAPPRSCASTSCTAWSCPSRWPSSSRSTSGACARTAA